MNKIQINQVCSFGTDGIRARADEFPLTQQPLIALGKAIAQWAREKYGKNNPSVLIGHDTRISCPRIKNDLIAGLAQFPLDIVDGDIIPTPAVYQLIKESNRFDFGIVISASHNPYYDNGIKLFDAQACKLSRKDEECIEAYFVQHNQEVGPKEEPIKHVESWNNAAQKYQETIIALFKPNFLSGIKIVLDCAHGATAHIAPEIFTQLGAHVIAIAAAPNGTNINEKCGATHPEWLQKEVLSSHAHIGFSFDGDGDRLVVINHAGEIKNGDDVVFLLLEHPEYATTTTLVGTIMSNQGLEQSLARMGKKLIRTNVGDKYIAQALEENKLPLGGEISGHTIVRDYLPTSDGIFVALKVLESVIVHNNWDLKTFQAYQQVLINLPVAHKKDLSIPPLSTIIDRYKQKLPQGRILVRYSGTEKLLRVMAEDQSPELAHNVAEALAHELQNALAN